jgi:PAS domain-containing protein
MIPKLSEHTAHLAQVKRGLDQISEGFFTSLPTTEAEELGSLFASFNRMSKAVAAREESLRDENVQLATAVSRIETLLDASIDGVAFIGQDLSFSFVNRRFCEILGLRPGELSRKNVIDAQVLWQDTLNGPQRLLRVLSPVHR